MTDIKNEKIYYSEDNNDNITRRCSYLSLRDTLIIISVAAFIVVKEYLNLSLENGS